MKPLITIWKLEAGTGGGQETADQKREKGLEYIKELKKDPENKKVKYEEENNQFKIKIWKKAT